MCLMLDQFLWGHSSRVCDISCSSMKGDFQVVGNKFNLIKAKAIGGHSKHRSVLNQIATSLDPD